MSRSGTPSAIAQWSQQAVHATAAGPLATSPTRAGFPLPPASGRHTATASRGRAFRQLRHWTSAGLLMVAGGTLLATTVGRRDTADARPRPAQTASPLTARLEAAAAEAMKLAARVDGLRLPTLPAMPALSAAERAVRAQVTRGEGAWRDAIGEPIRAQRGNAFRDAATARLLASPTGQRAVALFGMPRGGIWIHESPMKDRFGHYKWHRDRIFLNRRVLADAHAVHPTNTTLVLAHELAHGMAARGAGVALSDLYVTHGWRPRNRMGGGVQVEADGRLRIQQIAETNTDEAPGETLAWGNRPREHLAEITATAFVLAEERLRVTSRAELRRWQTARAHLNRALSPGVDEMYAFLLSHPVYADHPDRDLAASPPWDWRTVHDRGSAHDRQIQMEAVKGRWAAREEARARETQATRARDGDPRAQLAEWRASALNVLDMSVRQLGGRNLRPAEAKDLAPPRAASSAPTPPRRSHPTRP